MASSPQKENWENPSTEVHIESVSAKEHHESLASSPRKENWENPPTEVHIESIPAKEHHESLASSPRKENWENPSTEVHFESISAEEHHESLASSPQKENPKTKIDFSEIKLPKKVITKGRPKVSKQIKFPKKSVILTLFL